MSPSSNYAIFCSTSDNYFAGTCVMLHSFLQHNDWFQGDIILVSDDLKPRQEEFFKQHFNNLSIQSVQTDLSEAAASIGKMMPNLMQRYRNFYNLQLFLQSGYQRLLMLDADMLFRHNVKHLFELTSDIAGCPAGPMYYDKSRARDNMEVVDKEDPRALSFWMNSGVCSLNGQQTGDKIYRQLMEYLTPDFWSRQGSNHTDQVILNLYFEGRIEALSPLYNFLLPEADLIFQRTGLHARDAYVWHFNDQQKPWQLDYLAKQQKRTALMLKAQQQWLAQYSDCMMSGHLKAQLDKRRDNL